MLAPGQRIEFTLDGETAEVTWASSDGRFIRVQGCKGWIPVTSVRPVIAPSEIP